MKQQATVIAACILLVLTLGGCSNTPTSTESRETNDSTIQTESPSSEEQGQVSSDNSGGSSLFSNDGWPENEVTAAVPVPQFSVPATRLSQSDESITITYDNVPEAEAESFIQAVKDAGFTYNALESTMSTLYSYDADNSEDIYTKTGVNIQYSSDGQLYISVHHRVD